MRSSLQLFGTRNFVIMMALLVALACPVPMVASTFEYAVKYDANGTGQASAFIADEKKAVKTRH